MRRPLLGALLALLALPPVGAAPAGAASPSDSQRHLFEKGNTAFKSGNYAAAIENYEALRKEGLAGAGLLYNLGNAYFKAGDLGRAVSQYERALLLAPRDPDLRANAAFAREACVDRSATGIAAPLILLGSIVRRLTPDEWAIAFQAAYLLFLGSFVAPYFLPLRRRLAARARLAAGLVLIGAGFALYAWQGEYRPGRRGVVVAPEITIRSGPSTGYLGEFSLHPGSVVRIEEHRDGWVKIVFPPSLRGWTEASGIEIL